MPLKTKAVFTSTTCFKLEKNGVEPFKTFQDLSQINALWASVINSCSRMNISNFRLRHAVATTNFVLTVDFKSKLKG